MAEWPPSGEQGGYGGGGPAPSQGAGQSADPWAAAHQGEFVYRPGAQQQPDATGWGGQGERGGWGAAPGARPDADPNVEKRLAPAQKATPDEVKTGQRLAVGCWVVGAIVVAVAAVLVALFYRASAKSGLEAVENGIALKAKVELDQAIRIEQTFHAQNDKYTDDATVLQRQMSSVTWVRGTEVNDRTQMAVTLCGADGVLVQKKANDKVYFAAFVSSVGGTPYYAKGQQQCPATIDQNGNPGEPWGPTQAALGIKDSGGGNNAPAPGGPKPPSSVPTGGSGSSGGSTSNPSGGSGGSGGSGVPGGSSVDTGPGGGVGSP